MIAVPLLNMLELEGLQKLVKVMTPGAWVYAPTAPHYRDSRFIVWKEKGPGYGLICHTSPHGTPYYIEEQDQLAADACGITVLHNYAPALIDIAVACRRAVDSIDGVDVREGHIRDNSTPDELRDKLLGCGLKIADLEDRLRKAEEELVRVKADLKSEGDLLDGMLQPEMPKGACWPISKPKPPGTK